MKVASIREAQHHLSKLVNEVVSTGQDLVLTRRGKQVCKITAIATPEKKRVDWKSIVSQMDGRLGTLPKFDYGIVERLREDDRF